MVNTYSEYSICVGESWQPLAGWTRTVEKVEATSQPRSTATPTATNSICLEEQVRAELLVRSVNLFLPPSNTCQALEGERAFEKMGASPVTPNESDVTHLGVRIVSRRCSIHT